MNNLYFIGMSLVVIIYIIYSIRKDKLSIQNSGIWILFCITMIILAIFPYSLDWLARLMGIDYPPALFLTIAVIILFVMNFTQSKKIEELHKKVIDLGQEVSILKEKEK